MVLASNNFKQVKRPMTMCGSGNEPVRRPSEVWNEDCRREIKTLQVIMTRGNLIFRHDGVFDGLSDIQSGTSKLAAIRDKLWGPTTDCQSEEKNPFSKQNHGNFQQTRN